MRKFSELIEKSNPDNVIKSRFRIMKSDDEKMLAFGWANVSMRVDGELIEDWQADIIEPEELENAAYEYVLLYREGGEMHERGGVAVLIESVVFTEEKMQAMGIPAGTLPVGWPLLGDGKYGGGAGEIALWSYRLSFPHPVTHKAMSFTQAPSGGKNSF